LADGSEKKVEELVPVTPGNPVGDVLIAADGTRAYVIALEGGPQISSWPMVRITAESIVGDQRFKHWIEVCPGHNFLVGYTRAVRSSLLRVGDHIQSEFGEAVVTSVDFVPNNGVPVWDFYLASEGFVKNVTLGSDKKTRDYFEWLYFACRSSLFGLTPKQHLIFANGLLAGDLSIQRQVREADRLGHEITTFV
jgi:hypothetical protein